MPLYILALLKQVRSVPLPTRIRLVRSVLFPDGVRVGHQRGAGQTLQRNVSDEDAPFETADARNLSGPLSATYNRTIREQNAPTHVGVF